MIYLTCEEFCTSCTLKSRNLHQGELWLSLILIRTYYRRSCYPSLEEICKPNPGAYFKQRKYVKEVLCCTITHICMATPKPSLRWSHRAYLPPIPHLYLSYSMSSLKTFLNKSDRIVSQPDYRDVPYPDFMELRHTMALER